MPTAAVRRYWDWLALERPYCVCGARSEHFHHIIHVNGQRITNDDMLVIPVCQACHQGKGGIHDLGGEEQFLTATGWDVVHWSILNRHNYELRRAA